MTLSLIHILRVNEDSAFVPSEQLIGFLCIKDDRSRDAFASAELDILATIAAQLGIDVYKRQPQSRASVSEASYPKAQLERAKRVFSAKPSRAGPAARREEGAAFWQ